MRRWGATTTTTRVQNHPRNQSGDCVWSPAIHTNHGRGGQASPGHECVPRGPRGDAEPFCRCPRRMFRHSALLSPLQSAIGEAMIHVAVRARPSRPPSLSDAFACAHQVTQHRYPNWTFHFTNVTRVTTSLQTAIRRKAVPDGQMPRDSITNFWIGVQANFLICTPSSNWCRALYRYMIGLNGAVPTARFLDRWRHDTFFPYDDDPKKENMADLAAKEKLVKDP